MFLFWFLCSSNGCFIYHLTKGAIKETMYKSIMIISSPCCWVRLSWITLNSSTWKRLYIRTFINTLIFPLDITLHPLTCCSPWLWCSLNLSLNIYNGGRWDAVYGTRGCQAQAMNITSLDFSVCLFYSAGFILGRCLAVSCWMWLHPQTLEENSWKETRWMKKRWR